MYKAQHMKSSRSLLLIAVVKSASAGVVDGLWPGLKPQAFGDTMEGINGVWCPAELDALLVTYSEVQPLLLSSRMMEVFKVSYKPQRILINSDGSVCSLIKKRISDVYDSQFVSDVREPLEMEELMD
nr:ABC transporter E family member 2 isoform X1 [Tanacetum cinerariifolium]